MIDKIQISPTTFKGYSTVSAHVSNHLDNQPREFNSDFYVNKRESDTIKSYNYIPKDIDINKPISLNGYVNQLERSGLVKDRDFVIVSSEENKSIYVHRGDNMSVIKVVRWHNGTGKDAFDGYEDITYPYDNDTESITKYYNQNMKFYEKSIMYKNPDAHKDLFPIGIDKNTTPELYIENLKERGINYKIDKGDDYTYIYEDNKETYFNIDGQDTYISQHYKDNENDNVIHNFTLCNYKNDDNYYRIEVGDFYRDK